jgi:hypothetical protein
MVYAFCCETSRVSGAIFYTDVAGLCMKYADIEFYEYGRFSRSRVLEDIYACDPLEKKST